MESFSEKYGYKPIKEIIQIEGVDSDLRNSIWNTLDKNYWWQIERIHTSLEYFSDLHKSVIELYELYFKVPLDTMPTAVAAFKQEARDYFFSCKWYEVFDFIQFIANHFTERTERGQFITDCNEVMKRELSGYRFVGTAIVKITSEEEIAEIEEALRSADAFEPISIHLQSALDKLADKEKPDYRNSIKESISAVEAMCNVVTGRAKSTLGDALKRVGGDVELHPALKEAFSHLYGYTSDAEGIRHSLLDAPKLDYEDAKFMLVTCSAFINYLKVKISKTGIVTEDR